GLGGGMRAGGVAAIGVFAVLFVVAPGLRATGSGQTPVPQPAASASPVSPQKALLTRYCVGCHNQRLKSGGLALETIDVELVVDVDAASLLPADDASHGFDNVNVGALSPTLLDRYLAAAQKVSRLAVGGAVRSPGALTVVLPADLTQDDSFEDLPYGTRGGT